MMIINLILLIVADLFLVAGYYLLELFEQRIHCLSKEK